MARPTASEPSTAVSWACVASLAAAEFSPVPFSAAVVEPPSFAAVEEELSLPPPETRRITTTITTIAARIPPPRYQALRPLGTVIVRPPEGPEGGGEVGVTGVAAAGLDGSTGVGAAGFGACASAAA